MNPPIKVESYNNSSSEEEYDSQYSSQDSMVGRSRANTSLNRPSAPTIGIVSVNINGPTSFEKNAKSRLEETNNS